MVIGGLSKVLRLVLMLQICYNVTMLQNDVIIEEIIRILKIREGILCTKKN